MVDEPEGVDESMWRSHSRSSNVRMHRLAGCTAGMRMAGALMLVVITTAACGATSPAPTHPASPDQALPSRLVTDVTGDGAFAHLEELQRIADAHGGNRALGTPGYDASIVYVASTLRAAGYHVQIATFEAKRFEVHQEGLAVEGLPVPVSTLEFSPATPEGGVSGPLAVMAREGCEAADAAAITPGAVALVRQGTCPFAHKAAHARAAGAVGMIVINTEDTPLVGAFPADAADVVPTGGVSRSTGDVLAGRAGMNVTLTLSTAITPVKTFNVLAQTRTGNPDEVVVAGAHLDSVPEGPGVNDNGSGVAALLETAVHLGGSPPVANAVRFAFWGAEEAGAVGSSTYVKGLAAEERARIALYVNVDVVASPNPGYLVIDGDDSDHVGHGPGPKGSAVVERVLVEGLAAAGATTGGTDLSGRSGYRPFVEAGIPSGGLSTGAEEAKTPEQAQRWGGTAGQAYHPCHHQACDRIDTVDRIALDRSTDAIASAVVRFALSTEELTAG
jgi:Zn-dependent M28 family amino/carboxypeptidase